MVDLHRHDDFSIFDGLGKPLELAKLAKEYGYTSFSTSNHGTTTGMVEHYIACKEVGIKPILGVEVYFMPTFKEVTTRYHLCLFCKNLKGYQNLNRMLSYANVHNYYYKPIVTFELLEKYHEGLICTSACLSGFPSAKIAENRVPVAKKALEKFKDIFGEDFYVEIQPYKVSEKGLQEKVNHTLMSLTDSLNIKCVITSDSHFGRFEDINAFISMHLMRVTLKKDKQNEYRQALEEKKMWIMSTYGERYMPTPGELRRRFMKMHEFVDDVTTRCKSYLSNLNEIESKVDEDIFKDLSATLPIFDESRDSDELLLEKIKDGLKCRNKYNKEYWNRCKDEFEIIKEHGFSDYFLIVQEFVSWAKEQGIEVGPGRGSVCNCEVAYALGITEVDSLYFNLDFMRFLRKDKKKLPDIDIDFETSRRGEVIEHLIKRYKGKAVQICSYGMFKVDNLINDLSKVCLIDNPHVVKEIKDYIKSHLEGESKTFNYDDIKFESRCKAYNFRYKEIIECFSKMYNKVRYIGTHAAGVAISGVNILDHIAIERRGKKYSSAYDLNNLEKVGITKFDMLGLRTLSIIKELKDLTGESFTEDWIEDTKVYENFREGNTEAIFQFEKPQAIAILQGIHADCIEDLSAANALNRPGPLGLKMPEQYAYNKANVDNMEKNIFFELTKETYGTVVYQEQISLICRKIGGLSWGDADKVLGFMKGLLSNVRGADEREKEQDRIRTLFVKGARQNGVSKQDALEIFSKMLVYSFNKGHATGYALIALQLMWYKVHYPMLFWFVNLKYAANENNEFKFKREAIKEGNVLLTCHVNGNALYSLKKIDGEMCIQEGMSAIKGVGMIAAQAIEDERKAHGKYVDIDDLCDRVPKHILNSRVLQALKDAGACEFFKDRYYEHVVKYNTSIAARR